MPGKSNDYKPGVRLSNAARAPIGQSGGTPSGALAIGGGQEPLSLPRSVLMAPPVALPSQAPQMAAPAPAMQAPAPQQRQQAQQARPQQPQAQYQQGQQAVQQALPGAVLPFPTSAPLAPRLPASVMQQQAPVMPSTTAQPMYSQEAPAASGSEPMTFAPAAPVGQASGQTAPPETAYGSVYSEEAKQSAKQSLMDTSAAAMEKAAADIGDFYSRQGMPWLAAPAIAQEQANITRALQDDTAKLDLEWAQAQEQSRQAQATLDQQASQWNDMEPQRRVQYLSDYMSLIIGGSQDAASALGMDNAQFTAWMNDLAGSGNVEDAVATIQDAIAQVQAGTPKEDGQYYDPDTHTFFEVVDGEKTNVQTGAQADAILEAMNRGGFDWLDNK